MPQSVTGGMVAVPGSLATSTYSKVHILPLHNCKCLPTTVHTLAHHNITHHHITHHHITHIAHHHITHHHITHHKSGTHSHTISPLCACLSSSVLYLVQWQLSGWSVGAGYRLVGGGAASSMAAHVYTITAGQISGREPYSLMLREIFTADIGWPC